MNDKMNTLRNEKVLKLVLQYSIPAVIAMLVSAIYNIVDRMFIGNFVGEDALAGLTIAFPVMMIVTALGTLLGMGASALIAIELGKKNEESAKRIFGNMIILSSITTIVLTVGGLLLLRPLLVLFGASVDILPFAYEYMSIIFGGMVFQLIGMSLNNIVRTEGKPQLAMNTMLVAAVTNIILDYLFVVVFRFGIQGAAFATIIGQGVLFTWLVLHFIKGNSLLKPCREDFRLQGKIVKKIYAVGLSQFVLQVGASISMAFMNHYLFSYGGDQALTALGAINSLFTIFIMPMIGVQMGIQPILGYNYGAKLFTRVKKTLKYGFTITISFSLIIFVLIQTLPKVFISLFLPEGSETIGVAVQGLRIFFLFLPILPIQFLGTSFFQSIAKAKVAMFLSASRQIIILIPALMILSPIFGLKGVWVSTPFADFIAIFITAFLLFRQLREMQENREEEMVYSEQPESS